MGATESTASLPSLDADTDEPAKPVLQIRVTLADEDSASTEEDNDPTCTDKTDTLHFISRFGSYFSDNSVSFEPDPDEESTTEANHDSTEPSTDLPRLSLTLSSGNSFWSSNNGGKSSSSHHHSTHSSLPSLSLRSFSSGRPMLASQLSTSISHLSDTPVPHDAPYLFVPDKDGIVVHTLWTCKSVRRIVSALKWHCRSAVRNDSHKLLRNHVSVPNYKKRAVNDYQHLINAHLLDFAEIRKKVIEECGRRCNPQTCLAFQNFKMMAKQDLSKADETTAAVHFIHLVHCYVMH